MTCWISSGMGWTVPGLVQDGAYFAGLDFVINDGRTIADVASSIGVDELGKWRRRREMPCRWWAEPAPVG